MTAYINLSAQDKFNRANQINTDLGANALLMIYSGTQPISPDITVPSGNLLATLTCASGSFGTVSYELQNASTVTGGGGSGGNNGTQTVTVSGGTLSSGGVAAQVSVTITSGAISAVNGIALDGNSKPITGDYSALPTLNACAVTGAGGLTGAKLNLAFTAAVTAGAISQQNATVTGTAGFARLAPAGTSAGGAGIIDLDIGTSGTSVIINTTSIVAGGPVVVSGAKITEG